MSPLSELHWNCLPFEGAQVEEVVIFGSGKDTDLRIRLTDGRAIKLAIDDVRIIAPDGVVMESEPWDDVSRIVRVSGPDLSIRRMAVAWPGPEADDIADLAEEVRTAFQPDGQRSGLSYVVSAELELERATRASGLRQMGGVSEVGEQGAPGGEGDR